jgi:hypothetical protein
MHPEQTSAQGALPVDLSHPVEPLGYQSCSKPDLSHAVEPPPGGPPKPRLEVRASNLWPKLQSG